MIIIFNFHMKDVLFFILKQVLHDDILKETEILGKHHRDVVPRKSGGLQLNDDTRGVSFTCKYYLKYVLVTKKYGISHNFL